MTTVAAPVSKGPGRRERLLDDPRVVVGAIAVLALVVGVVRLGAKDVWIDEGATIGLLRLPFDDFLHRTLNWEVNQSAYYVVARAWYPLGDGTASLRFLSVLFTVATIPVLYLVGRRLYDEWVGVVAALLLLALHGMVLSYSQMMRSYTMVLFLVTVATWALLRAVDRPGTGSALLYAAVATLAVYAHFFAILVVGAHAVSLLVLRPFPRRLVLVVGAVMALPMLRIAHYVVTARSDPIGWIDTPSAVGLVQRVKELTGGSPEQLVVYTPLVVIGLALSVAAARSARPRSPQAWRPVVAVSWLVLPVAFTVVTTYVAKPLFESKYLIVVIPALVLVAAAGVVGLPRPSLRAAAGAALAVVSLLGVAEVYRRDAPEAWEAATASVLTDAREDDGVVVVQFPGVPVVRYYRDRAGRPDVALVSPRPGDEAVRERLWEVSRTDNDPTLPLPPWDPRRGYREWREEHYRVVEERPFPGLVVRLLERRA